MNIHIVSSLDKFVTQQRVYAGYLEFLKRVGAPELLIVKIERDMARNTCKFLMTHSFPSVHPRSGGNKSTARRTRPPAGSERAKPTASTKGK